jgi:predicted  nucleic acid-binding Zn-ribbon protein
MANPVKINLEILAKLQFVEKRINRVQHRIDGYPQQQANAQEQLEAAKLQLTAHQKRITDNQKQYRALESEAAVKQSQIVRGLEKQHGVKTNKEYQSITKELEDGRAAIGRLEDQMIDCLEQIEQQEAHLPALKQQVETDTRQMQTHLAELDDQQAEAGRLLATLENERRHLIDQIDEAFLARFQLVQRRSADHVGIVAVQNSVCTGCNVNLPPQMYHDLQRCDELYFCPNCQRMIYWADAFQSTRGADN